MVQPKNSKLTLLQEAQATDLLLNDLANRANWHESLRFNAKNGKPKTNLLVIARKAHERFFKRYQIEIARTGQY